MPRADMSLAFQAASGTTLADGLLQLAGVGRNSDKKSLPRLTIDCESVVGEDFLVPSDCELRRFHRRVDSPFFH